MMAMFIHFDNDSNVEYDTLGIGIGHREETEECQDDMTMGIGIGHRKEKENSDER